MALSSGAAMSGNDKTVARPTMNYPKQPGRSGMLFMPDVSMLQCVKHCGIVAMALSSGAAMSGNDKTVARPTMNYPKQPGRSGKLFCPTFRCSNVINIVELLPWLYHRALL
ncbi:hypothetical protein [Methyloprofundus sedimenti]|nr:hypothetical protein [Methyloprofundus sedimenti]